MRCCSRVKDALLVLPYVMVPVIRLGSVLQVRIMKDWDPTGKQGPKTPLPDVVTVHTPKEEEIFADKPVVGKEKDGGFAAPKDQGYPTEATMSNVPVPQA